MYYIRSRGRITGPFALPALQQLQRRGRLTRFDQISDDRASWTPAGEIEELFGAPPAQYVAETNGANGSAAHSAGYTPEPASAGGAWYYSQGGMDVGPVPLEVLRTLAGNGTLTPEDSVWQAGASMAASARHTPALASYFSKRPGGGSSWSEGVADFAALAHQAGNLSSVLSVIIASLLVTFTVLPVIMINGEPIWWWDAIGQPGAGPLVMFSLTCLICGIAVAPVALAARGIGRGATLASLAGLMLLSWYVLILHDVRNVEVASAITVGLTMLILLDLLVTVSRFRMRPGVGGTSAGKVLQGIAAGGLALLGVAGLVGSLAYASDAAEVSGAALAAAVLALVFQVAVLAAGVLGLVDLKQEYTPGVNITCFILSTLAAAIAVSLLILAAVEAAVLENEIRFWEGSGGLSQPGATLLWLAIRFIILFLIPLVLMTLALDELLPAIRIKRPAR